MTERSPDLAEFPMPRANGCPFDPAAALTRRIQDAPIGRARLWDGSTPWLITSYRHVREVLGHPGVIVDVTEPGFPHTNAVSKARDSQMKTLMQMDAPEHTVRRRMLAAEFTVKKMEQLRPGIQRIVDELLERMLSAPGRTADLVDQFALPLPSLVISDLLGVPYADRGFFQGVARTLVMDQPDPRGALAASDQLNAYLEELVVAKEASPGDDLLSRLAVRQYRTGAMTARDIAVTAQLLLVAGHDTTANMIALGTAALLANEQQLDGIRDGDGSTLVANAVEELLRYLTITHTEARRVAGEDLEIGGRTIRRGEGIVVVKAAANRDPSSFPDPDTLDIRRRARHHVAFGYGAHQCLGQPLARVELQVAYETLFRRIPTLRLAVPLEQLTFTENAVFYGVKALPLAW